ncbi:MAG: single-stranded-DNA-specific exonuclease RecJ [Gammaproteobacteria bacterium]|nr:single-stranded-DNA-specific exonuclease RecJ [Gammaproteobacteria bacterium]
MTLSDQNEYRVGRREVPEDVLLSLPEDVHPVLRRVYAARHVDATQIEPKLSMMLPVSELAGAQRAAVRLADALEAGERLLILGDFDADGATATALCISCLTAMGFRDVCYLVPNRVEFGYGLSVAIADEAAKRSPDLIVTVDNGISSHEGVARANELGMDVVITDHHLPGASLPEAQVIVNPNSPDEPFPSKCLAGVGVAFYVMAALGRELARRDLMTESEARKIVANCLDLVALGTVADLVPLDFNNRILVTAGLARMRGGQARPGLRALFSVAGRNIHDVQAGDLGFAIAPRLNAAGRLTDMSLGIDCLLASSDKEAEQRAARLDALNLERRTLQTRMEAQAREHVQRVAASLSSDDRDAYCLFDDSWHEGVVGLVASRIKDQVSRPVVAFALADSGRALKGSARSVEGIHIRDVLDSIAAAHPGLIKKFGGHAMAAGLSLDADKFDAFDEAFAEAVSRYSELLSEPGCIWTDGALSGAELGLELAEQLRSGGPWGQGFPEPIFENVLEIVDYRVLKDAHLKLRVSHPDQPGFTDAIAFNQAALPDGFDGSRLRLVYRLDVNEFRQRRTHQLVVEHMQCA